MVGWEAHLIENLNDYKGLTFSYPQEHIVSIPKNTTELMDVVFGVRIKFCEFF